MMVADQELLTVREAAERLNIKVSNIREWIRRGAIAVYKPEIGRLLVDVNEIEQKLYPRKQVRS